LYDDEAQRQALNITNSMSAEEREFLRSKVPELGLETPYKDGTVRDLALEVLSISRRGLERRGRKEGKFLDQLDAIAQSGESQSDVLLKMFREEWSKDGGVDNLYTREYSY
jgi:glutamate--cysteine ligase